MTPPVALALLALALAAAPAHALALDDISDEQFYEMPPLFHLDDYSACSARRGVYCVGSFELSAEPHNQLYELMQHYSADWVDQFNHTLLHRGLCLSTACPPPNSDAPHEDLESWFSGCVNASTMAQYQVSARLAQLQSCARADAAPPPPGASERALAALLAALLALAALASVLDATLPAHARKAAGARWALCWSLPGSWRVLTARPAPAARTAQAARGDLRAFDGLRVLCMMCVIIEHVCWINMHSYIVDTRRVEKMRRSVDVMLMVNSTLVVQIFFMMSSFLLAHKVLQDQRGGAPAPFFSTYCRTMLNRIIRISPSYFVVVWLAGGWWARAGGGPLWAALVGGEASVCRRRWWAHLLYLNNVLHHPRGDKCLIQTWYLAADMQLYAAALALTLLLRRAPRAALAALTALLAASVALLFALAYLWHLVPTFVMHCPESVRSSYSREPSFNVLYQSPLGNVPGALAGLLLAHAHHALLAQGVALADHKVFGWVSVASAPLALWWVAASPRLLGPGPPARAPAAALAALERPLFSLLVAVALLGALQRVPSTLQRCLSWPGWALPARLSFGALLLHMPLNTALVAARLAPAQLDRHSAIIEWFGVACASYLAAIPLALLVEVPAQRLLRELTRAAPSRPAPPPAARADKTDL